MKRMKKFAALLLVVAMTFGMVACSSSDKKEESTKKETKTEEKSTKKLDGTLKKLLQLEMLISHYLISLLKKLDLK